VGEVGQGSAGVAGGMPDEGGRVWALPFLTVLAPSERYCQEHEVRHRTLTDWAKLANRDRGAPHDATPPTPPGIRVRTTAVRRIKRPPASPWTTVQDL
jgi:hypothetical protein